MAIAAQMTSSPYLTPATSGSAPGTTAAPAVTAAPVVPPPVTAGTAKVAAPAIVTSAPAVANLNQTKGVLDQATAGMQAQAQAKAAADAQAKAAADQAASAQVVAQQQALDNKLKASEVQAKIAAMQQQAEASAAAQHANPSVEDLIAKYSGQTADQTGTPSDVATADQTTGQPSTGSQALDAYVAQQKNNSDQAAQALQTFQDQVNQIKNGTFPLTADQQAMVQGIQDTLAKTLASQRIANANYEGGVTQLGITQGLQSHFSGIQMGNIQAAVSTGVAKINDLENQATQAIASLRSGFMKDDMDLIQKSYTAYQDAMDKKQKSITDIYNATNDFQKQVQTQATDAAKTAFDQKMKSDQLTLDQKKQALDEAIRTGTLTLDQQKAAETQWKDEQDLALKKQATDPFSGAMTGNQGVPVTITTTGTPNKLQQATFLQALPQQAQTFVKGLTDYTMNPVNLSARIPAGGGMSDREKYLALAHQYDPSFDESQFNARAAFNKNWTSGQTMTNRIAINTGINHLQELTQAAVALQNKHFQSGFGPFTSQYNTVADLIKAHSGDPAVSAYNSAANKVATELAKIYKGTASPTEQEIAEERKNLDLGLSPEQLSAVVGTSVNLIAGRLQPLVEEYQNTMGQPPKDPVIGDSARQAIIQMRQAGTNIDISRLDPGNEWRYMDNKEYMSNNPDQAGLAGSIIKSNPGISDLDLIDALHAAKESQQQTFNQPLSMGGNGSVTLGSRLAVANNNPGNLRFVGQAGATQGEGGFAKFASPEAGVQAFKNQITLDASRGNTLESFINKYAPPSENDTGLYVKQMASALGVDPSTKLNELDLNALAKAMARKESGSNIG